MMDEENYKAFDIESGTEHNRKKNRVIFKRDPRYGSWTVNFDKGRIPELLKGKWSSFNELYGKVEFYLNNRREESARTTMNGKEDRKRNTE